MDEHHPYQCPLELTQKKTRMTSLASFRTETLRYTGLSSPESSGLVVLTSNERGSRSQLTEWFNTGCLCSIFQIYRDVIKQPENVEGLGQEFTAHVYTRTSVCKVMRVSERVRGAFGGYHIGRNDSKTCDDDSSCEVFW